MATFAVQYTYIDDADRMAAHRPEHREHLAELHREGLCCSPAHWVTARERC